MQPAGLRAFKEIIMHRILLAALALAAPAQSQMTPPGAEQSAKETSTTAQSTESVPSTGPRARQAARSPRNNASIAANATIQAPPLTPIPAGAIIEFRPAPSLSDAFPPPAALESYPVCKSNQYDKCVEPGMRKGGAKRTMRRR